MKKLLLLPLMLSAAAAVGAIRPRLRDIQPSGSLGAALHFAGRRTADRTHPADGHGSQAGMDVRKLLPQYARHHRPLPSGRGGRRRHLCIYGRHPRHVAARFGGAGVALPPAGTRGRSSAPADPGRRPPPAEMPADGPLRQRLQRRPHRNRLAGRLDGDEARSCTNANGSWTPRVT